MAWVRWGGRWPGCGGEGGPVTLGHENWESGRLLEREGETEEGDGSGPPLSLCPVLSLFPWPGQLDQHPIYLFACLLARLFVKIGFLSVTAPAVLELSL